MLLKMLSTSIRIGSGLKQEGMFISCEILQTYLREMCIYYIYLLNLTFMYNAYLSRTEMCDFLH